MAINTTSSTNTPQAGDDTYSTTEDYLIDGNVLILDVMSNDLGGKAKVLWSIDDGYGNPMDPANLLSSDIGDGWESTHFGNQIRIYNGHVEYKLGNADAVNALGEGEIMHDTFTYAIRLGNGTLSLATVHVDIVGNNDAPVANADNNSADPVVEAGVNPGNTPFAGDPSATGNVLTNDTDADNGAVLTVAAVDGVGANVGNAVTGTYGSVTIGSDGSYTYTLNNADPDTNALAQGVIVTDVFSYTVTDEHGATSTANLTITITGTNDGPVAVADVASGTENQTLDINVLANDTDVDDGHVFTLVSADAPLNKGVASVAANQVHFVPGTDFDHLAQGVTEHVTLSYTMQDEFGAQSSSTVDVTITGVNDTASIAGDTTGSRTEDDVTAATGTLVVSDVDDGEAHAAAAGGSGDNSLGSYTVDADGNWSYTVNNAAVQHLTGTASTTDTFTVMSQDGTASQLVTITINGVNDTASIAGTSSGSVTEDGPLTALGTLTVSDADDGQAHSQTATNLVSANGYGHYSIDANGNWSYLLDNSASAVQALNTGQTLTDTFTVTSTDSTASQTVTITINGVDDNHAPVAADDRWFVSDNTAVVFAGSAMLANDTDADGNTLSVTALSTNGTTWVTDASDGTVDNVTHLNTTLGDLSVNSVTGAINYATDNNNDAPSDTPYLTESFFYRVSDGSLTDEGQVTSAIINVESGNNTDTINLNAAPYNADSESYSYIDLRGGNDTLTGSPGADTFIGGQGNDMINIGVFGPNDDIDGGGGTVSFDGATNTDKGDILVFDGSLDLTALAQDRITNIETLSMSDSAGGDSLTLNVNDVIDIGNGTFDPAGSTYSNKDAVRVDGDAGDTVTLSGGNWQQLTGISNVPTGYNLYVHDTSGVGTAEDAYILVKNAVLVA
jgi:VCBS repeat-containing protein